MTELVALDHSLFHAVNGLQGNSAVDSVFLWGTQLGAVYFAIPLGVLLLRVAGVNGGWPLVWRALVTGTTTALMGASLKLLFVRPRPLAVLQNVHVLGTPLYELSFPSGHSITAFTVAGIVTSLDVRTGTLAMLIALFVGVSRIYVGAHFPSDVVAGALLGFFPSWLAGRAAFKAYRDA